NHIAADNASGDHAALDNASGNHAAAEYLAAEHAAAHGAARRAAAADHQPDPADQYEGQSVRRAGRESDQFTDRQSDDAADDQPTHQPDDDPDDQPHDIAAALRCSQQQSKEPPMQIGGSFRWRSERRTQTNKTRNRTAPHSRQKTANGGSSVEVSKTVPTWAG